MNKISPSDEQFLASLEKPQLRRLRRQRLMTSRQQRKILKARRRRMKSR